MKAEFTVEQIRKFVSYGYTSIAARYVQSALVHIDELDNQIKNLNGEIRESGKLECPNCNVSHIIAYNNSKTKAKCIHCGFIWTI